MRTRSRFGLAIAGLASGLMVLFGVAVPASASPGQVVKMPVAGAQFTCTDGTAFTAVSGEAVFLFHESTDAQGGDHVTGTVAPVNVTLTHSSDSLLYQLGGASWFGGNTTAGGAQNFTDTEHFQILGPSGGAVGSVSIVAHATVNADGTLTISFERDTGTCLPPQD
jgi:hypothetical protein